MDELAAQSVKVLAVNYPDYPALDENGQFKSGYTVDGGEASWINKATFGLFNPPKPPQFDSRPNI
jgi:outer membrane protein assembly factor BamD